MSNDHGIVGFDFSDLSSLDTITSENWPKRKYQNATEYMNATEDVLRSSNLDPDSFIAVELTRGLTHMKEQESKVRNDLKGAFEKDTKIGIYKIASHLIELHNVKTIGGEKVREVFVYRCGVHIDGINILRQEIRGFLGELCTSHYSNEIIDTVKDLTPADRADFCPDNNLINLNNGVYDLRTNVLLPHDPKYLFFTKLPIDYREGVDCPKIKTFLSDIVEPDTVSVLQECFGFGLYRKYFIKKAFILVGEPNTGKSTFLRLMKALYGMANVSGVNLQSISRDKFSSVSFHNKYLNVYDDLSFNDIKENGNFKMVTGGDSIPGEYKFKNQFLFDNYAKLIFACNKIPNIKDSDDDAYFDRWVIVHFNNIVDKDKIDPFLVDKLTAPEELSGLLNFALDGLRRLLINHRFSYEREPEEIKEEMQRSGLPIADFAYDCLEEGSGVEDWISKEDMYNAYVKYARSQRRSVGTIKLLGSRLPKCATYISDGKVTNPDTTSKTKQITAWRNVKLKAQESNSYSVDVSDEPEQPTSLFIS